MECIIFASIILPITMDCDGWKHVVFADLQGFIIENNQFVLKELSFSTLEADGEVSVHNLDGREKHHYIFAPPFPWQCINNELKKSIFWLTAFHHGFYWNCGNISYEQADQILEKLCSPHLIVYVKGFEKIRLLRALCKNKTIDCRNIEDIGCNIRLHNLSSRANLSCGRHKQKVTICALQSVSLLENWYYGARQQGPNCEGVISQCQEELSPQKD